MHPILVEQLAKQRTETFDREAAAARLVSLARSATAGRPTGVRGRLARGFAHVRVFVGGAPA